MAQKNKQEYSVNRCMKNNLLNLAKFHPNPI